MNDKTGSAKKQFPCFKAKKKRLREDNVMAFQAEKTDAQRNRINYF